MILTEEEIEDIENRPFSQNDWLWFYTRAIEQAILNKLQDKLKNAERYEWLRNTQRIGKVVCQDSKWAQELVDQEFLAGEYLDKAIDSAMEKNNV